MWTPLRTSLLDRRDRNHPQALAIRDRLIAEHYGAFTTSLILAETHALLLTRLNQRIATQFLRELESGATTIVWVTPSDVDHARSIIYRYEDKDFSLTDATSSHENSHFGPPVDARRAIPASP